MDKVIANTKASRFQIEKLEERIAPSRHSFNINAIGEANVFQGAIIVGNNAQVAQLFVNVSGHH